MGYEKMYTSDMSDSQWKIVKEILKKEKYKYVTENAKSIDKGNTYQSRKESKTDLCTD